MVKNKKHHVVFDKAIIYEMRQTGATMREIGEKVGICRERVRQILLHTFGSTRHELMSTAKLCALIELPSNHIMRLYKQGIITPAFGYDIGGQHRFMWPATTIQVVKDYYDSHHVCRICKKPMSPKRTYYCSDCCKRERYRYKNLTPEEKQRIRARMLLYREKKRLKA